MATPLENLSKSRIPNAETLDCTGLLCPLPIFKTSQVLARLQSGDVLKVVCTDPGSLSDFPALSKRTGHELLAAEEREGVQKFWIRKR